MRNVQKVLKRAECSQNVVECTQKCILFILHTFLPWLERNKSISSVHEHVQSEIASWSNRNRTIACSSKPLDDFIAWYTQINPMIHNEDNIHLAIFLYYLYIWKSDNECETSIFEFYFIVQNSIHKNWTKMMIYYLEPIWTFFP